MAQKEHFPGDAAGSALFRERLYLGRGGIRTPEVAQQLAGAGADCLVVGTAAEDDAGVLPEIAAAVRSVQSIYHN